jgi:hypothetical protein
MFLPGLRPKQLNQNQLGLGAQKEESFISETSGHSCRHGHLPGIYVSTLAFQVLCILTWLQVPGHSQ